MIVDIYHWLRDTYLLYSRKKHLNNVWDKCVKHVALKSLSKEQEREIITYWLELTGKRVNPRWHQLLYSITGVYTVRYMPFEIYMDMIDALCPTKMIKAFDDKALYRYFFPSKILPQRVAEYTNGCAFLPENEWEGVTYNTLLSALQNIDDCIIKPSAESCAGNGVSAFTTVNGIVQQTHEELSLFLKRYGNGFVIERKVHECNNLAVLNPSSCNTLRIHTYRDKDGSIHYVSSFIRIGKKGAVVDNGGQGGLLAQISREGIIGDAWTIKPSFAKVDETDSGILIKGYKVENMDKVITTAIKAHHRLSMFGIIGWDFAIDENNNPIMIEFNPNADMRTDQIWYYESCLLDKQEEIMKLVYK